MRDILLAIVGFQPTICLLKANTLRTMVVGYKPTKASRVTHNGLGLCVVALSRNLKLTTTLDRAITQNPCYVPFLFRL